MTEKTILMLDWNGTVMADLARAVGATNAATSAFGIPSLSVSEFQESFTLPMAEWLSSLGVPTDELAGAENEWNRNMQIPASERAEAVEAFRELHAKGIRLGVISAAQRESLEYDIRENELTGFFSIVEGGVADKEACLSSIAAQNDTVFYVGDTAYDVQSARGAGCISVSIGGGYQSDRRLEESKPDHHVKDLLGLVEICSQTRS